MRRRNQGSLHVRVAETRRDVARCRALVRDTYGQAYGTRFSDHDYDLHAGVECWPHRFLMAEDGNTLAATIGLYAHDTYVERFGDVTREDLDAVLFAAGTYDGVRRGTRELTKLSVAPAYRNLGVGRQLLGCATSLEVLTLDGPAPVLLVCLRQSLLLRLWHKLGIFPRFVGRFPHYPVHARYRSKDDPMASYLMLPQDDIPAALSTARLPMTIALSPKRRARVS